MADLHVLPTVDELIRDPARAADLPPDVAAALLPRVSARVANLTALRDVLLLRSVIGNGGGPTLKADDIFDDIEEAAGLIGRRPSWIYKHKGGLPFVIQEGSGCRLRFSRAGIERYVREHSQNA